MTEIALFTTFATEIIASLFALIIIIITRRERARLEREIAQTEERNLRLREEVTRLREQCSIRVVTKKPVIMVIQNQSPEVKQEEVTPEIPTTSPSPDDYDPNNFPIKEEDSDDEDHGYLETDIINTPKCQPNAPDLLLCQSTLTRQSHH